MDTLALLCNLHADGPETLQRLRSAGWDTLEEIESVDVIALDQVLGVGQVRALRFQREARHLQRRLEGDAPGSPERDASATKRPDRPADKTTDKRRASGTLAAAKADTPAPLRSREPEREPEDLREIELPRNATAPERTRRPEPAHVDTSSPADEPPRPRFDSARAPVRIQAPSAPEIERSAREVLIPHPAERPGLEPTQLDGLDRDTCDRLARAGVKTLQNLAGALPLELSRDAGIDYTRLLRLQFLARRAADARSTPRADPTPGRATRPPRPQDDDPSSDVAGPFA
jgi:hypothetical protein